MKWIGQYIWDSLTRFRNDVYLEDISDHGSDPDRFLTVDSTTGKITYRTGTEVLSDIGAASSASDVTGITITADDAGTATDTSGDLAITVSGGEGIDTSAADAILTITSENASDSNKGIVQLATTEETATGTDTAKVVTPDGLKDGYQGSTNVTTLGTISSGVWNSSTVVASVYLDADTAHLTTDQTFTGLKTFDVDRSAAQGNAGAENITALHVDFDRAVPATGTYAHNDIGIDLDVTSASLGASSLYGMDINVLGTSSGTSTAYGIDIDVRSADTNYGIFVQSSDTQLKLSHNPQDYATFTVANTGDLTIATVGDGTRDSDLTLSVDGDIKLEPAAGNSILLDGTIDIDAGVVTGATSITSTTFVGDVTGDVSGSSGSCTGQAATVATIAGLAPNTATTQATQPAIESIGTDGDTLSILSDTISISNTSAYKPDIKLINTADDSSGPYLQFFKNRTDGGIQDGEDDDLIGTIDFWSYDDGTPSAQNYARIIADIHDATSTEESGRLTFKIANHDGGLGSGLILTGGSEDNEIDATVGLGANSIVTIPGSVSLGTALATNQQKHVACFDFKGYATHDGSNYEMPEIISDNKAPFDHDTSTGSDGLTAQTTTALIRAAGHVMPYGGTLKIWKGWAVGSGSGTTNVGLLKITPVDGNTSNIAPVLLINTAFTVAGNDTPKAWSETSFSVGFSAGDIIISAIKGVSTKRTDFSSTLEVEWT